MPKNRNKPSRPPKQFPITEVLQALREAVRDYPPAIVTAIAGTTGDIRETGDPSGRSAFKVLISTILSLRTKDETTAQASQRLFKLADTPRKMLRLTESEIADAIYPVGFYRTKATSILENCRVLVEKYNGRVPDDLDALLELKGVGRKTANLVLTMGYGQPGICVDTHVHRITNRWGWLQTRNPDETEMVLREHLPGEFWIPINDWLVTFGQRVCKPVSPHCSACRLACWCARRGVDRSR